MYVVDTKSFGGSNGQSRLIRTYDAILVIAVFEASKTSKCDVKQLQHWFIL